MCKGLSGSNAAHAYLLHLGVLHAGFNAEYLLHHEGRLRTRISAIEQEAIRLVGSSINLASAAQLSVALYDTLALPTPRNRSDRSAMHKLRSAGSLLQLSGMVCALTEGMPEHAKVCTCMGSVVTNIY